jgi:hypothetical protein
MDRGTTSEVLSASRYCLDVLYFSQLYTDLRRGCILGFQLVFFSFFRRGLGQPGGSGEEWRRVK